MTHQHPSDVAILVVDVQKGFMNEHTMHLPDRIGKFLENNRFEHRIFTRFVNPGVGGFYHKHLDWLRCGIPEENLLVSELAGEHSVMIMKDTYSCVHNGYLGDYLTSYDVSCVYICGIATNACVLTAAYDLFDMRIDPVVIADLCASHSGMEYHQIGLDTIRKFIGKGNIIYSKDIPQ